MLKPLWWPPSIGVLAILLAAPAQAQEVLTLPEATQQALTHHAGLRAAQAEVAERDARMSEARAGWFPRISVTETWQRGDQPVFVFSSLLAARQFTAASFTIDALERPDAIGFHRTSVVFQQPLFDGRLHADVERARLMRDAARLTLDESRATLAATTAETYGRIVVAHATHHAIDSALEAGRADRARAAARRDAGMATDADVLALDAHVAALAQQAIQADADEVIARASLNRLMGSPVTRTYLVAEWLGPDPVPGDVDLGALLAEAEAARPELRLASLTDHLARTERRLARASLLPRVSTQAAVEVSGTRFDDRASSWLMGAEVSWNVSLGGAERARLRAAARASDKAAAEADDARAAVDVEVVSALTERRAALARVDAGRAAVAQAHESERIVRDRFEAGMAGVTDLLRAQGAVLDAEAERTAAVVAAMVSNAKLTRALGRQP
jgi:outer membrane protein TolC